MTLPLTKPSSFRFYSFFIWILAILFFFYEFFLRVLPATVSSNIISSLQINLEEFAVIGSAYYFTYSLMQVPVGILLDRFSLRILVTIAAGLCSLGALLFTFSTGFFSAFIARLFIGMGSSFGFVGLMVVTLNWFPKNQFAFMLGWGQFLGAVGPMAAGAPIALILSAVKGDWRLIFFCVAIFGFILTALLGLFIRSKHIDPDAIVFINRQTSLKKQFKEILTRSQIWWTMVYAALTYVSLPLIGAFWGTTFLEMKGFDKATASLFVSMMWIGLAVGSPLIGKVSEKFQRRNPFFILFSGLGVISAGALLYAGIGSPFFLGALFFLLGFAGSGQSLAFAVIAENSPKKIKATALGLNNTAIMGLASILPPLVTVLIQLIQTDEKNALYAFEKGLSVIPICFLLALLVALFGLKETFCRQQKELHILEKL